MRVANGAITHKLYSSISTCKQCKLYLTIYVCYLWQQLVIWNIAYWRCFIYIAYTWDLNITTQF